MKSANNKVPVACAAILLPALASTASAQNARICESLTSESSPTVKITSAAVVPAGALQLPANVLTGFGRRVQPGPVPVTPPPGTLNAGDAGWGLGFNGGRLPAQAKELPAFCRVTATLTPTPTSDIRAEIWLPMSGWNGNFVGTSPNGMGGSLHYSSMANALRDHYAVMGEDTGHRSSERHWMDDQERRIDFGHRAIHVSTALGKQLTAKFYRRSPKYAYIRECGGGSDAALASAQSNPGDYNGIVVGGFAAYWGPMEFSQMWPWYATHATPASYIPAEKLPAIHQAVLNACDALDGVRDGVLENPQMCHWDPGAIACKPGEDTNECLTSAQVEAVRKIYQGPVDPGTGEAVQSPIFRGSELEWEMMIGPKPVGSQGPIMNFFDNFLFREEDPTWDPVNGGRKLNWGRDMQRVMSPDIQVMSAYKPDISRFVDGGGKIIIADGWSNAMVPSGHALQYYKNVVAAIGEREAAEGVRLYMVPDMSECNGGAGTDTFDMFKAVREWVEEGKAPQAVIASRVAADGQVVKTRPLCPYPQMATYNGSGSTNEAGNFHCALPPGN